MSTRKWGLLGRGAFAWQRQSYRGGSVLQSMRGALSLSLLALLLAAFGFAFGTLGLAFFRRDYARRVAAIAVVPDIELAYGRPWLVITKTALFALRHPSTLRWGLLYAAHLLIGIDLLSAVDDDELARLHRDIEHEP